MFSIAQEMTTVQPIDSNICSDQPVQKLEKILYFIHNKFPASVHVNFSLKQQHHKSHLNSWTAVHAY